MTVTDQPLFNESNNTSSVEDNHDTHAELTSDPIDLDDPAHSDDELTNTSDHDIGTDSDSITITSTANQDHGPIHRFSFKTPQIIDDTGKDDYIFDLLFVIKGDKKPEEIAIAISINPSYPLTNTQLEQAKENPLWYYFCNKHYVNLNWTCSLYSIKGQISLVNFDSDIGQFCDKRHGFYMDLDIQSEDDRQHEVRGIFLLEHILETEIPAHFTNNLMT